MVITPGSDSGDVGSSPTRASLVLTPVISSSSFAQPNLYLLVVAMFLGGGTEMDNLM